MASAQTPGIEAPARASRAPGPLAVVWEYVSRIWHKFGRDDVLFLAGGVAFDMLLAGVPFFLLLASAIGYVLNKSPNASDTAVADFLQQLFPTTFSGDGSLLDPVLHDVVRTRGKAGLFGAVAFVWFSTRLFASMRAVLARVFDEPQRRGILLGKLFDVGATVVTAALVVAWIGVSAYIALARSSGVEVLSEWGLHNEYVMRPVIYVAGRVAAFVLLVAAFFAVYKTLPARVVRWQQALIGALTSGILFELARSAFTAIARQLNPGSLYTGTMTAIIVVVFWVYYAALMFIIGALVSQVHEHRVQERLSRATQ
ncbi:MAG: YihY/virulence factor BrkB family protein [Gemmatimonadetes bacterium]|nr:YihY/virulence factor BrkB family protein [Gemmatimonadota bacterium]MBI3568758.1 YihY/virulence factor BrkB family protein [Gemmatimonadota bacterium]